MKKRTHYYKYIWPIGIIVIVLLFVSSIPSFHSENSVVTEKTDVVSSPSMNEEATEEIEAPVQEQTGGEEEPETETLSQEIQAAVASIVENARSLLIQPNLKIVAVGDSLTQGVGDESKNGGYVGILENMIKESHDDATFDIENHGKRGRRTDHLIKRLENDEEMNKAIAEADVILLTIGANDIMQIVRNHFDNLTYEVFANEIDDYEERLQTLFASIREKNNEAPLYLIGVFNPFHLYFDYIPELNQIIDDWNAVGQRVVKRDGNGEFIPIDDIFLGADETYFAEDNFHPNQQGYAFIGERVFQYVEPVITTDPPPSIEGEREENDDN